jgi:hypothetical protein
MKSRAFSWQYFLKLKITSTIRQLADQTNSKLQIPISFEFGAWNLEFHATKLLPRKRFV